MYLCHNGECSIMRNNTRASEKEFELDLVDEKTVIPRGNGVGSVRVTIYGPVAREIYTRKTYSDGRIEFIPIEITSQSAPESTIDRLISVGISQKEAKKSNLK